MKKIALCLALVALCSCDDDDGFRGFETLMDIKRAELSVNNVAVVPWLTYDFKDLRIKLFCDFEYVDWGQWSDDDGTNPNNHQYNYGLDHDLGSISITCNKKIANIEAGENLVSIMDASVSVGDRYTFSIGEWRNLLNNGSHDVGYYNSFSIEPGMTYEFDIAFLPYYAAVTAGEYVFTLTMYFDPFGFSEREFNPKFTKTFPSVNLK